MCPAPQAGPRALFGISAHSVREAVLRVAVSPRGLLASGVNSFAPEVPAGRGAFRKLSPGNLPGRHRDRHPVRWQRRAERGLASRGLEDGDITTVVTWDVPAANNFKRFALKGLVHVLRLE